MKIALLILSTFFCNYLFCQDVIIFKHIGATDSYWPELIVKKKEKSQDSLLNIDTPGDPHLFSDTLRLTENNYKVFKNMIIKTKKLTDDKPKKGYTDFRITIIKNEKQEFIYTSNFRSPLFFAELIKEAEQKNLNVDLINKLKYYSRALNN